MTKLMLLSTLSILLLELHSHSLHTIDLKETRHISSLDGAKQNDAGDIDNKLVTNSPLNTTMLAPTEEAASDHQRVSFHEDNSTNMDIRVEIPSLLEMFCPGADVCVNGSTGNSSANLNSGQITCCQACSCAENCQETMNCCFPTSDVNTDPKKRTNCYSTLYPILSKGEFYGYKSYQMVDFIASSVDGNKSKTQCGSITVAPWGSLYPVYSKSRREIYKNSMCAEAAGVDDVVRSEATLACISNEYLFRGSLFSGVQWDNFGRKCDVVFEFPESLSFLQEHVCYNDLVSTCPKEVDDYGHVTGEKIKEACHSDLLSVYQALDKTMYKNVFCSICNDNYDVGSSCVNLNQNQTGRQYLKPFTALLIDAAFEKFDEGFPYNKVPQACLYQNGNKVNGPCRPVLCSTGQVYNKAGTCEFVLKTWHGFHIRLYIQLSSDIPINTTGLSQANFTSVWTQSWNFKMIYYKMNHSQSMITDTIMVFIWKTFKTIKPQSFIKNMHVLVHTPWSVSTEDGVRTMRAGFQRPRDYHDRQNYEDLRFIHIGANMLSGRYIVISAMSYCNLVNLRPDEFTADNKRRYLYNKLTNEYQDEFYLSDLNGESVANVCLEESGLSYDTNGGSSHAAVLVVFVSIFFLLYM